MRRQLFNFSPVTLAKDRLSLFVTGWGVGTLAKTELKVGQFQTSNSETCGVKAVFNVPKYNAKGFILSFYVSVYIPQAGVDFQRNRKFESLLLTWIMY